MLDRAKFARFLILSFQENSSLKSCVEKSMK